MTRRTTIRCLLVVAAVIILYVAGVLVRWRFGAKIVVRNQSGQTLRGVMVKVERDGRSFQLAEIGPGRRARIFLQGTGEYHVNVEYKGAIGTTHVSTVIGYAEAGDLYCPGGEAVILASGEIATRDLTTLGPCWESWLDFVR